MLRLLAEIGILEVLDILLVAILLYAIIVSMKSVRAGLAIVGILATGTTYILAREIGLQLASWILQSFFAISLVIVAIVFQSELRQLFERVAVWSLGRSKIHAPASSTPETIVAAMTELVARRVGALIVIPGKDPLDRHVQGGVGLNGEISQALLLSLFDPGSLGHDGAVVIEGDRVSRFSVHLPLSQDFAQIGSRGTRHSAALGLAERTDALCLVVSEERGEMAVAQAGKLMAQSPAELRAVLAKFLARAREAEERPRRLLSLLRTNWVEKALAAGLAVILWLVFVSGTQVTRQLQMVPVVVTNVHPDYTLERIEPEQLEVTLSGLRRDFYILDPTSLQIQVDAFLVGLGRRNFEVTSADVLHPPGLSVEGVQPTEVRLFVTPAKQASNEEGAPESPTAPP